MFNVQSLLVNLINSNPNVANNPRAKSMLQTIQNGDTQSGTAIADNLCRSYGVTREQAIQMARNYFHI